ncbi:MAG TPA: hypothetical protein VGQ81_09355, partial [Acidobacteriota bacterium]|nr:hypothetical protein [Acidobacteriota bacterium]
MEKGGCGEWGEWERESGGAGEWESGGGLEWESGGQGEWESGRMGEWARTCRKLIDLYGRPCVVARFSKG